ncbi:MAG: hypothetical protein ABSB19_10340 [Methylomonas sp.]|jgi:hypothetical protein
MKIPDTPKFDSEQATAWFISKLLHCKTYLEWGAGGSTYLAAQHHIPFIAVESDQDFLHTLKEKIAADGFSEPDRQTFIYANIGLTKVWGYPIVIGAMSQKRQLLFKRYSDFPVIHNPGPFPDLILVDGRFRVACALKAFKALNAIQHDWLLLVDDYVDRLVYHEIEKFGKLAGFVGRMAVFDGVNIAALPELDQAIAAYELDYR